MEERSIQEGVKAPEKLRFHRELSSRPSLHGSRNTLRPEDARLFPGDSLPAAFARALCERRATCIKELLEATERRQSWGVSTVFVHRRTSASHRRAGIED